MLDSDGSASSVECHVFVSAIYEDKTCKATEFVAQIIFFSNVIAFMPQISVMFSIWWRK